MSTVTKETFWTQIVEDPTLYGTIATEDNLFNYRSDAVWQVMNETFIANGTNFEVTKWEELLGLNVAETTLNGRKAAILNHITENLPITIGILEQLIKELTDGDYTLEYNEDGNKINIVCNEEYVSKVEEFSSRLIPIVPKVDYIGPLPTGYLAAEFILSTGTSFTVPRITENSGYYALYKATEFNAQLFAVLTFSPTLSVYHYAPTPQSDGRWVGIFLETSNVYGQYVLGDKIEVSCNYKNDRKWEVKTPASIRNGACGNPQPFSLTGTVFRNAYNELLYRLTITEQDEVINDYIPSIDDKGKPCLFDKIVMAPNYAWDSSKIVVGLTLKQARRLGNLPATGGTTGGTLTISLPTGYDVDSEVTAALETARSKGWTLTIQTYTPEESTSTTSTFGMQRIWVRKTQDENGSYVDANGNRFQVEWCVEIYSPENKTPEDLGYEQFRSVESAVEYWELTPYVDPTLEEQFNITNEEQ